MSSDNSLKILVSGDADGKFNQLFSRVSTVNKKNGPFDMLICVGNFFGDNNSEWEDYARGSKKAPITTYVLGPCKEEHEQFFPDSDGSELAHNITYLGRKGILSGTSGLKIGYLSGMETTANLCKKHQFNSKHVEELTWNFTEGLNTKGIDILVTSQWPKHVENYGMVAKEIDREKYMSELIAKLAYISKPRYHFAGLAGTYYERLPYRNHQVLAESARQVTRFIALNKLGNLNKEKWLYAFSITPMSLMERSELVKQPVDVGECPYKFSERDLDFGKQSEVAQQFFYNMTEEPEYEHKKGKRKRNDINTSNKCPSQLQGPCWFCLASPDVEKHLVVSIGDHNYLALAKGGLTPDHVLILPIAHHKSTIELPDVALKELEQFKMSLKKLFRTQNKSAVFFERNYKSSHLQVQVVPVPLHIAGHLKEIFTIHAENKDIALDEIPANAELQQIVQPGRPYFYVELETGEKLLHRIHQRFPLQFGREVLASEEVLGIPHCSDWKACKYSKDEEMEMAENFRKIYEPFDFTL